MAAPVHLVKTARRQMRKIRHRGPRSEKERQLLASADQQRAEGLGWRYDGFGGIPTSDLVGLLATVGLAVDEASFREEALAAGTPSQLAARWSGRCRASGRWADLPALAARELWRRLVPELPRAEVIADELDELLEEAEVRADRAELWLRAARVLLTSCAPGGRADRALFEAVARESGADLVGWMAEMPAGLLGTSDADEAPGLCEAFALLDDPATHLAERAEVLATLGRREEALAQIASLLERWPEEASVLLKVGASFEALGDVARAQEFLGRYADAVGGRGRKERAAAAPGPNDPCPCGSGRKSKRCCGLPS